MRDWPLTPSAVSDAVREASWTVRDGMGERLVMELDFVSALLETSR